MTHILTKGQKNYIRQRKVETDKIEKFYIHFGNIRIDCDINEPFGIHHDHAWCRSEDIKIDVYDIRVGDKVDIRGCQGNITKIETVPK